MNENDITDNERLVTSLRGVRCLRLKSTNSTITNTLPFTHKSCPLKVLFMFPKARPLFLIAAILTVIFLFLHFSSRLILLKSFAQLEQDYVTENVKRSFSAITNDIEQINTTTGDYAGWDDAYAFVLNGNEAFIKANLDDAIFPKLRLNLIAYVRNSGEMVFAKGFDLHKGKESPFPFSLHKQLTAASPFVRHTSADSVLSGILLLPEGPLLIVSRPVLTSAYKGPIHGAIIMGRFLGVAEVARLADISHLDLSVFSINAPLQPPEIKDISPILSAKNTISIRSRSNETITGYGLINDIFGKPALIAKVDMRRNIYNKGVGTVNYFIIWIIGFCLISALIGYFMYTKLVISRKKRKDTEERYHSVISQASDIILLVDSESRCILEANAAFQKLLGYSFEETGALTLNDVMVDDQTGVEWHINRILSEGTCFLGEQKFLTKDGKTVAVELNANLISYADQRVLCMVIRDISEREKLEGELMHMANYDSLTGLPNRSLFLDRLNQSLFKNERSKKMLSVVYLDLDQFKVINDTFGHHIGDLLLKEVAIRLRGSVRKADTVSRLGGDEFTLILDDIAAPEDSVLVADKILQAFTSPFSLDNHEMFVTASIGITLFPTDGDTADKLLKNSDTAMYHAKEKGRNNYQFFSEEMNARVSERLHLETGLRHALDRNEFLLHYQPRIEVTTGRIVGVEALIRWQHPEKGMISPATFIPLAEETGLIVPIGEWVLRTACAQNKAWQDAGFQKIHVSVNISVRQFARNNLASTIRDILKETGLAASCLELEITESSIMLNPEQAVSTLKELKKLGVSISIDDFGTGYSSLSHLKNLPVDILKVDQSFVKGIHENKSDKTLVSTIINMGHSLGLSIVAEGVETAEQLSFLGERSCQEVQGFFLSKPLSSESLQTLMGSWDQSEFGNQQKAKEI
ncbi:MAG: EAL domain-containing protein [Desulfuromonadales bacterium]|nr:EAL domain-containing protein [Desulfuromonadales bacterium]